MLANAQKEGKKRFRDESNIVFHFVTSNDVIPIELCSKG